MLTYESLKKMRPALREAVDRYTFDEAMGLDVKHSLAQIIAQGREPAIAVRMPSKPSKFNPCTFDENGTERREEPRKYTGEDIANIIIESVRKSKKPICYPLTGKSWVGTEVRQMYLFVGTKAVARFTVTAIKDSTQLTVAELRAYTDLTVVRYHTFSSVAYITDVVTENLPQDFLGNFSGKPISEVAFKSSTPLVHIL